MQVKFTKEQYLTLMKMVYLGNWMANSSRVNDQLEDYEKMEDYIFSFGKEFGFSEFVDDEKADERKFFPTRMFEENTEVMEIIDDYDNETFWQEFPDRLGERDFVREYGEEKIEQMDDKERFTLRCRFMDKWGEEMEDSGIERLEIKK